MRHVILALSLFLTISSTALAETRVEQILDRLVNANANRDHVMVVAHRGSW
ncbi:MAG: hypothetical protein ACFB6S_12495 [Geminicoccaceae bacterium]